MTIQVIPNGTKVDISADGIVGTVTSICIAGESHVTYQVCWWNGRSRESKWFEAFELEPSVTTIAVRIGFTTENAAK